MIALLGRLAVAGGRSKSETLDQGPIDHVQSTVNLNVREAGDFIEDAIREDEMSVFGNIMSAIFGSKHAAGVTAATGSSSTPSPSAPAPSAAAPSAATPAVSAPVQQISKADVRAILKKLDGEQNQKLNWNESIVDLRKLLKLDSSLAARRQLARELGYSGPVNGSARMNIWLHKQVMTKLAEGGGKVPDKIRKKA